MSYYTCPECLTANSIHVVGNSEARLKEDGGAWFEVSCLCRPCGAYFKEYVFVENSFIDGWKAKPQARQESIDEKVGREVQRVAKHMKSMKKLDREKAIEAVKSKIATFNFKPVKNK